MENQRQITLQFKCRRCGKIYDGAKGLGNESENIFTILMMVKQGSAVHLPSHNDSLDIHSCSDGGLGAADFVGIKYDHKKTMKFPKVYTVQLMTDENMKKFNEFCVKVAGDKNTKHIRQTGVLAVLFHFATNLGIYKKP